MRKLLISLLAFLVMSPCFADTLTVYPDAGSGSTTVDGYVFVYGQNKTFADIRASTTTDWADTSSVAEMGGKLTGSTTSNQFQEMIRGFLTFDTSSLGAGANISATTLSLYGSAKSSNLGTTDINIAASTQANSNNLVGDDFPRVSRTLFGSHTYAAWSLSSYNVITINSDGRAAISQTGITEYSMQLAWDLSGTFGGSWSSNLITTIEAYQSDETGTTKDPKLIVTYTPGAIGSGNMFNLF